MKYLILLMAMFVSCFIGDLHAQEQQATLLKIDSLPSLDIWRELEHSDTNVSISYSDTGDTIFTRKIVSVIKETYFNQVTYRISYNIIVSTNQTYTGADQFMYVTNQSTYNIKSLRKITSSGATIDIPLDSVRVFIPFLPTRAVSQSIEDKKTVAFRNTNYDVPMNNYNHFRKVYQNAYVSQGFLPFSLSIHATPMAAYRLNHINEAQFTHAAEQQARADDEGAIYSTALEIHAGISHKNRLFYVSLLHLRSGFQSTNGNPIDWNTGLTTGLADAGKNKNLFYQNGVGLGYYSSGYGRRLVNACVDVQVYYLRVSKYSVKGQDENISYKRATELRDLNIRPGQLGAKFGTGISIRPNYAFDISIVPTVYCNISSIATSSVLRSNLVSYGLTGGFTYRWMKKKYSDPVWYRHR